MDFTDIKNKPYFRDQLERIKTEYKRLRDAEKPELTRELFDYFYETGSRKEYEAEYFKRRGALLMSALMSFIYGGEEHIKTLTETIELICDEFTWALPAHMSKDNPHPDRVIDLFAAETGQALSEICDILGDNLRCGIRERVGTELERRIIRPFIEERFDWESFTHNWAAVCGGAVGMTFLYAFPDEFRQVEDRINCAMQSYLSGFGDDGISPEGLGYWNYGFWYFTGFADLYKKRCGVDIMDSKKVKRIAMCQQNLFLRGNNVISYSDCGRYERFNSGLAHYLRGRFGNDVKIIRDELSDGVDNCYRFLSCLRSFMWINEDFIGLSETQENESYFEDAEWYVYRGDSFAFSAKSGNNGESHNHNDIGSFIIAADEGQLIADYGSGEYTHDYFTEKRYEHLCTSSRGHSVPIIDGKYQLAGSEFKGTVIKHGGGVFETDIAGAYGGAVKRLNRRFVISDNGVELTDNFEFNDHKAHDITERFISVIKPEIRDGAAVIGNLILESDAIPEMGSETLKSHGAKDDTLYFVDYKAGRSFNIKFYLQ